MKVVLLQDVKKLGQAGDVCDVSPGYAKNFLFRQNLATELSKDALNDVEMKARARAAKAKRALEEAKATANRLNGSLVTLRLKAGHEGKLYGAVTAMDIASRLVDEGYAVDKRQIVLKAPIKTVGVHDVEVKLHTNVTATFILNVAAEQA